MTSGRIDVSPLCGEIVAVLLRRGAGDTRELASALPAHVVGASAPAEIESVLRDHAAGARPLFERGQDGRWRLTRALLGALSWTPCTTPTGPAKRPANIP